MDWGAIITELGGGLSAVTIAGLAFAYWRERAEHNTTRQQLIDTIQRHGDAMVQITRENVTAIQGATGAVEALTKEVMRNG